MKKIFLLLGLLVFTFALDIKLGSTQPRHAYSSSKVDVKKIERTDRPLPTQNIKRDDEVALLDAYLERATLCTNTTNYAICSHGNATFASGNKNYQHDLIFNPNTHEYFLVYIQESGTHTSILGQLMDDLGNPIGSAIGVVTYGDNPGSKHNPRVAYNTQEDVYFVVFDYITVDIYGNQDEDIGGMFIAGNGTKIGEPFYVGTSAFAVGVDHNARVTYNSEYDYFLVVHSHEYNGDTNIIIQPISLYGNNLDIWEFGSEYDDTDPDVTYNPSTLLYYLVWTTTDPDTSNIYGVQVDVTGQPFGDVATIGDTTYFNGTQVRDHNAILVFEQTHNNYLVLFEVDLEGNDAGATNIIGRRVDLNGVPQDGFAYLGSNNGTYNRNPSVVYGAENDEYVVAYEALVVSTGVSTIRAAVVNADDLTIKQDVLVSDGVSSEYFPAVSHDSLENSYLIMWNHGDPEPVVTTTGDASTTIGVATGESAKKSTKTGAIVGGIFGALAGVAIIAGVAVYIKKRQRTKAYELHSLNEH